MNQLLIAITRGFMKPFKLNEKRISYIGIKILKSFAVEKIRMCTFHSVSSNLEVYGMETRLRTTLIILRKTIKGCWYPNHERLDPSF